MKQAETTRVQEFRRLCHEQGLAATHQRETIYLALMDGHRHPSPEELYAKVHKVVPSISLATVYKALHVFVAAGLAGEMKTHGATTRADANPQPHHHAVCSVCHGIFDVALAEELRPAGFKGLPDGFEVQRCAVEVQGLCSTCAAQRRQTIF